MASVGPSDAWRLPARRGYRELQRCSQTRFDSQVRGDRVWGFCVSRPRVGRFLLAVRPVCRHLHLRAVRPECGLPASTCRLTRVWAVGVYISFGHSCGRRLHLLRPLPAGSSASTSPSATAALLGVYFSFGHFGGGAGWHCLLSARRGCRVLGPFACCSGLPELASVFAARGPDRFYAGQSCLAAPCFLSFGGCIGCVDSVSGLPPGACV